MNIISMLFIQSLFILHLRVGMWPKSKIFQDVLLRGKRWRKYFKILKVIVALGLKYNMKMGLKYLSLVMNRNIVEDFL